MGEAILVQKNFKIKTADPLISVQAQSFFSLTFRLTNQHDRDVTIFYELNDINPTEYDIVVAKDSFQDVTLSGLSSNTSYTLYAFAVETGQNPSDVIGQLTSTATETTSDPTISSVTTTTDSVTFNLTNNDSTNATVFYGLDTTNPQTTASVNAGQTVSRTISSLASNTSYTLRARAQATNKNMSSLVATTATTQSSAYLLSINSAVVDSGLSNFPVMVRATSANYNMNLLGNDNVYFTDNNNNLLNFEIEINTSSERIYHVKVPSISSTSNTTIKLWFDGSGYSNGRNASDVWSEYHFVFHYGQNINSVVNGYTGTNSGTTVVSGPYGEARSFNGTSNFITYPGSTMPSTSTLTFSAFFNGGTSLPKNTCFIWATSGSSRFFGIHLPWSDSVVYYDTSNTSSYDRINKSASSTDFRGNWKTWHFTLNLSDSSSLRKRIYIDGNQWHTGSASKSIGSSSQLRIGADDGGTTHWHGIIKDLRMTTQVRSNAWIKVEHNNFQNTLINNVSLS